MAKRFSKPEESAAVEATEEVVIKYRNISSTSLPLDSGAIFKPGDERFLTEAEMNRFLNLETTSRRRYIAAVQPPAPIAPKVITKAPPVLNVTNEETFKKPDVGGKA